MKLSKKKIILTVFILLLIVIAIILGVQMMNNTNQDNTTKSTVFPDYANSQYKEIYLAGGCFWGMQAYFDQIIGIEYTAVGYANGESENASYRTIGSTGHAESVYVVYDPQKISLETIISYFYNAIDPTSVDQQGNDIGTQYRSGIFYNDNEDKVVAEQVTEKVQLNLANEIVTQLQPIQNFILAEDYHQSYLDKNPSGYCHINLNQVPNKKPQVNLTNYPIPPNDTITNSLTDLQFAITQNNATESAFDNKYWDNFTSGLYVDIITGAPLFTSIHKYDSGCGWPAFTRPIQWDVVIYQTDISHNMERKEVKSQSSGAHLGHVFYDGPIATGGLRYCINSGSLNFIPIEEMEAKGYGKFLILLAE